MESKRFYGLNMLLYISAFIFFHPFNAPQVQAGKHQHQKAHVHGVAHINVALEGNELYIEFTSPAANIVGFEHHPRTKKEKNAVNDAIGTLKAGEKLFALPRGAGARLMKSDVETEIENDSGHESKEAHEHEHGEISEEKEHDGHHHENHKEDEHGQHSEFKAVYRFACKNPDKLTHIKVMLFRAFKGIEHIEVQILTRTKQTAMELTSKKNKIVL